MRRIKSLATVIGVAVFAGHTIDANAQATVNTIASFNGTDGVSPGGLVADSQGDFYGTTSTGGTNNDGTVFEIPAGTNTINTLVSFNGTDGADPIGPLTFDAAGNLYGT